MSSGTLCRLQEFEITPFIRAKNLLRVELSVSPLRHRRHERTRRGFALGKLIGRDEEINRTVLHRQSNPITVTDESQRAAGRRVRRDVQDDRAERRSAHTSIGQAHHVLDALRGKLLRNWNVTRLRHAACRKWPRILQHEIVIRTNIEDWIIDAVRHVLERREYHCPALALEQLFVRRRSLQDRTHRCKASKKSKENTDRLKRLARACNHLAINPPFLARQTLPKRFAGDRHTVEMEVVLEFAQHRPDAASREKVFHVV